VGENGNGKTTLLRMMAGQLAIDSGHIEYHFDGRPETNWTRIKYKLAFVPQRTERWYGRVFENLSFYAAIKGITGQRNLERTEVILHRMGLTNFAQHTWSQLSSGYRLRFEIARALVWEPAVMILDEPLANLDLQSQQLMLDDLRNLANSRRNPVSIMISSQQLHEVESVADQIIFLKNGRAAFNGKLEDFRKQQTTRTFEIGGKFTLDQLEQVFAGWEELKIEQTISAFVFHCAEKYQLSDLLKKITEHQLEIEYFRDITGSTKILFNDKY
jgi:ABC-2 type transport system ATP-binding protein